ncbi:PREDICTED: LOW QUALITY PROTEIN: la-related protein 6A-like, partial [Erythranthe guttata]|uniref:LOW QUALITY PROTEIN: la-related protein 6A-like n=1 Tax=Erythranthe guttata TaxID=4155 RepID=UPI00064DA7C5
IIKQVEYYLSDENLPNDKFLMKYVTNNVEGFVPLGVIASFRKMKKLTRDMSFIVSALKESDLRRVFGEAGNIKRITVRDPHDAKDPKKCTDAEKLINGKMHAFIMKIHALVEYDNLEAAEKAVATLNNEQDWRYGLRVKFVKKLKPGHKIKMWKESEAEKASNVETSVYLTREKNEVHLAKEKNGQKGRNRGRGRRQQQYHGPNGHGHGTQFTSHGIEPSKPPPGPKMPDGTRGFTMGRGRPLATTN